MFLLIIFFSLTYGSTIENSEIESRLISTPVGKIFKFSNNNADDLYIIESLPKWLTLAAGDDISHVGQVVFGIPQVSNIGHYVFVHEKGTLEAIEVVEETENECNSNDLKLSWIEILHPSENLENLSIMDQIQWINRTYDTLRLSLKELDNTRDDFRIFNLGYLTRYRTADETISEDFPVSSELDKRAVLILNISCGELTQYATDVISAVAETSVLFRVVSGELNVHRSALRTTTSVPYKSFRTTREITDNRPVAFNQLTTYHCKRGILCRLDIGENTFMDAEEGSTSRLRLFVYDINDSVSQPLTNFLVPIQRSTYLEGVPLIVGSYRFRVEARDRLNQTASLPFQVNVDDIPDANHLFLMTLDSTLEKFNKRRAETLREFVYQLSAALTGGERGENYAKSVRIQDLEETGPSQITIRWSNVTLSRRVCQERAINDTRAQMVLGKNHDRVKHEFRRSMGAQFYVKRVSLKLSGACVLTATTKANLLTGLKIRATTVETAVDAEPTNVFVETLMIPIILLAMVLLFVTLLIIFYCMHVKNRQQRKKKQQQSEFIMKGGLPIVFPQEVPHDDNDCVTTPMLVAREQPPLDPSRMTLHENPLYKPPPTAQVSLRQNGNATNTANPTSTFLSSSNDGVQNLVRQSPFHGSTTGMSGTTPRSAAAVVGQRSPPPYTAAI